jgi:hypothetical protein
MGNVSWKKPINGYWPEYTVGRFSAKFSNVA